ncbi:hypothetical protein Tco_0215617 [Tanacetum coccineum]
MQTDGRMKATLLDYKMIGRHCNGLYLTTVPEVDADILLTEKKSPDRRWKRESSSRVAMFEDDDYAHVLDDDMMIPDRAGEKSSECCQPSEEHDSNPSREEIIRARQERIFQRRCPQHFQMLKVEDGDGPDIEANESRGESVKKANRGGRSNGSYMAQ